MTAPEPGLARPAATPATGAVTEVVLSPPGVPAYPVVVGAGVRARVTDAVCGATRVAILHTSALRAAAAELAELVSAGGAQAHQLELPDAEAAKTVAVAQDCWGRLAEIGLTRDDAIVGLGGGALTDLAGFVAATWLRGVRLVLVPTTLLAMVDAAIGGKTAVNVPAGKNLVGAFHHPVAVLADIELLASLPVRDFQAGLAEVVKAGFIADPVLLELLEADPSARIGTAELIARAVAVKAAVVSADPREAGPREVLNYGHTLAHAIEAVESYRWRHGDAVSVGLVYAAELARLLGRLDAPTAGRHAQLLAALGLPVSYRSGSWPALYAAMRLDKKARGHRLRFVVLDGLARPGVAEDPDPGVLAAAFTAVAA